MNGLALRISSIRSNESYKKNSEVRMNLFRIPDYYKKDTENAFITQFDNCPTVEGQIKSLKDFTDQTKKIENQYMENLQILTNLYMESPLKHAVKNTISKFLCQLVNERLIVKCLSKSIQTLISNNSTSESKLVERNNTINSIGNCLENFKYGPDAGRLCLKDVLQFFSESLILFSTQLNEDISPSDKSEISVFIHNIIRFTITCFNQFPVLIKEEDVKGIVDLCTELLDNLDIPMDTKINCGILITMKTNLLDDFLKMVEQVFLEEDFTKKLCLLNGIVCVIGNEHFQDETGYKIYRKIIQALKKIGNTNTFEPTIVLAVSRTFVQLTKNLLTLDVKPEDVSIVKIILKANLEYVLLHLEHHMDSVRHLTRDLLKLSIQMGVKLDEEMNQIIFGYIETPVNYINTRCLLIGSICSIIKSDAVLKAIPNLIEKLLKAIRTKDHPNNNLHIINCYETLMMSSNYENEKEKWFQMWVHPLLEGIKANPEQNEIRTTFETLIQKAIKIYPESIHQMLKNRNDSNFGMILSSLSISRKTGLFDKIESNETSWKAMLPYEEIKSAMVSSNNCTRVATFHLLMETHKTTEIFTQKDFDCILYFLEMNCNEQSPSVRQKMTNALKNGLNRFQAGFAFLIKRKVEPKTHYYFDFAVNLHQFCINNLFNGANYSRRMVSFKILLQLLEILKELMGEDSKSIWKFEHIQVLLNCLDDSYESNKGLAIEILKYCPIDLIEKFNDEINFDVVEKNMKSVKPNESLTSTYYLEYLCFINITSKVPYSDKNPSEIYGRVFEILNWCNNLLEIGLENAQKSLIIAARENPLYGTLFSMRHLLSKIDFKSIAQCEKWKQFITGLLKLCRELTNVVSIVVNNSSPEGHLPNDFSEVGNFLPTDDDQVVKTTPQMVLLCSWRVIKEVSLILGDISFKSPVIRAAQSTVNFTETNEGLIHCSQILDIGAHFTELLSETKHRGAFEQAYVGFSKLCIRLWGAQENELHTLPMKWLNEMVAMISGADYDTSQDIKSDKLCATRRSAGVPFMIQALITSELQVSSSKGLQFCMKSLVQICANSQNSEARTHSLNILRTLFRCTDLGEFIGEYVSDGIICSIKSYDAECWSERNSSTLLFSALMIRIFGVQRTRDSENLNIRNKMTGRIFFLRYPQLYDFFMVELKEAFQIVTNGSRSKKLHPLLLLLSRLYPSALEGSESNLKLSKFVPIVSLCSRCAELQTRHLAAKFISIIVSPELIFDRIFLLLDLLKLSTTKNDDTNAIHGMLLQILYLVRTQRLDTLSETYVQTKNWIEFYNSISNYLFEIKPNFILYASILDILLEILARYHHLISLQDDLFVDVLSNIVDYLLCLTKQKQYYGSSLIMRKIALIKYKIFMYNEAVDRKSSEYFLIEFDNENYDYEFSESMVNLMLLTIDYEGMMEFIDEFDFNRVEMFVVQQFRKLRTQKTVAIQKSIVKSTFLHLKLKKLLESKNTTYDILVKGFTLLSYTSLGIEVFLDCKKQSENIKTFQEMAMSKPTQLKTAIFKCVRRCLEYEVKNLKANRDVHIEYFLPISTTDNAFDLRETAVEMLKITAKRFNKVMSFKFYSIYSRTILQLLRDDNVEIRIKTAEIVTSLNNTFMEEKIGTVLAQHAQKVYLNIMPKILKLQKYDVKQIIAIIYIIAANEDELEEDIEIEGRVFDKNEVNVYGESELLKEYCRAEITNLLIESSLNLDEISSEILNISENYVPSKLILEQCIKDTMKPLKLINIVHNK